MCVCVRACVHISKLVFKFCFVLSAIQVRPTSYCSGSCGMFLCQRHPWVWKWRPHEVKMTPHRQKVCLPAVHTEPGRPLHEAEKHENLLQAQTLYLPLRAPSRAVVSVGWWSWSIHSSLRKTMAELIINVYFLPYTKYTALNTILLLWYKKY